MKRQIITTTIFLILITSCSSTKPEGKTEAEILYKEAKTLIEDGRFILATEKLNQLKNRYPYSFYATPAELLEADILFRQENFVESAAAYMLFRDFHPKHENLPFVIYRIAESYYKQIPDTFDRDLQGAQEAIKYYEELLQKYPSTEYVKDAKEKVEYCNKMLQSKEQYIADFYFKTEKYNAAKWRYLDILENFSEKNLRNHSMLRVVQSSYYLKNYQECINYADKFNTMINDQQKNELEIARTNCTQKLK